MNVLITSAGRRIPLVRSFQAALEDGAGEVLVSDVDPLAPCHQAADSSVDLPRVSEDGYIDELFQVLRDYEIGLLVPRTDIELPLLARHRDKIEEMGITSLVSSRDLIEVTEDKWWFHQRFEDLGFDLPRSWLPEDLPPSTELPEDLFIKPRQGSSSKHAYACSSDDLATYLEIVPDPIVQERLPGIEITVDGYFDLEGEPIHYCPRERLKTVGGESFIGRTKEDNETGDWLRATMTKLGELGARGPLCFQAFVTDDGPKLTEVNARFGGGFPLTEEAGGRYPEWAVAEARGEELTPKMGTYERDLYMTKYPETIMIRGEGIEPE